MPVKMTLMGKEIHLFTQGEYETIHDRVNKLMIDVDFLQKEIKVLKSKKPAKA